MFPFKPNPMRDISNSFGTLYQPIKAFVIFEKEATDKRIYVESYDFDKKGFPINSHPLSLNESKQLAKALDISDFLKRSFLKPTGLLPKNVLYLNPDQDGFAIWHTPAQKRNLYFVESLKIQNGEFSLPPLLWKASKKRLSVFALNSNSAINEQSPLYHAPFFNLYKNGEVCMGTVSINIQSDCSLEEFITQWENNFFNSYFSHLIMKQSPVKGNLIQLWQKLFKTQKEFPLKCLTKNGFTLKDLLS